MEETMISESTTKDALLAALREDGAETITTLRSLPPETFERHCSGDWSCREVVAHLASVEWTYPRLIGLARQAQEAPGSVSTVSPRGGIDDYNARQVARRAEVPLDELFDEFSRNRAATIAAVEAVDEALLAVPIRSAGGIEGTLGEVLRFTAIDHVQSHLRELKQAARD
jgi:hypothetical protein